VVSKVISAAPSRLEADTPSLSDASPVPSAITVTFSLWSGMLMSVCEWRLIEIFESRVYYSSVTVIVGPDFGPERQAFAATCGQHSEK
jgi:hypothetical protein